ncbi:hypothetical protein AWJ20_1142 [Sugiyamaella lignohabitans]|uniref:Zn(2)-C6 fungal-type domain-containing protein n=1 Tax=Sugiyamaella lignohabitans TaxID=796027 RepID=A0A167DFN4_9ASCO|nr:uncharacterized protein AWJ20_1142 [Sugiyamaella lignohabitans]ANB12864.1 hypothetical protein AWJ20_1142 [Sugiyamaella lignohabitans]
MVESADLLGDEGVIKVESESQPAKRHRVSRACLQCRNRKIKCNGQEPTCGSCATSGTKCEYSESKKRGLPSGYLQQLEGYVKRIEQMLGAYIISNSHGEQELYTVLDGLAEVEDMNNRSKDEMDRAWQNSGVCKRLKESVANSDGDSARSEHRRRLSITQSKAGSIALSGGVAVQTPSNSSPGAAAKRKLNENTPDDVHHGLGNNGDDRSGAEGMFRPKQDTNSAVSDGHISDGSRFLFLGASSGMSPDFKPILRARPYIQSASSLLLMGSNNLMKSGLDSMALTDRISLLDTYFSYVHSWLPMVNKVDLIRVAYSMESFSGSDREMLLWATLEFASHISRKTRDLNPFRIQIQRFISESALGPGSLERVQALLLIALIFFSKGYWDSSWTTIGLAVRVAYEQGFHAFNTSSSVFSKRTWYACCIIDTLIAARLGRPPHTSDNDFELDPIEEDGWEEWELWKPIQSPYASLTANLMGMDANSGKPANSIFRSRNESWSAAPARSLSIFNALLPLVRLLNNVISQLNQPSFAVRPRVQRSLFYNDITAKLQLWGRNLPEHCSLADLSVKASEPIAPHKINLYLTFIATASLFYTTDEFATTSSNFFVPQDTLPTISSQLLLNFGMSFPPSHASPFFEYFSSIPLLLAIKTNSIRQVTYPGSTPSTVQKIIPLAFLEESWPGVTSLSLQYFTKERFAILDESAIYDKKMSQSSMHGLTNALQAFAAAASLEAGLGTTGPVSKNLTVIGFIFTNKISSPKSNLPLLPMSSSQCHLSLT